MVKCWAHSIGGCSNRQSEEHYISAAILGHEPIEVSGFTWAPTPTAVPPKRFVRNMLCTTHNSALSPTDNSALKTLKAFSDFTRVAVRRLHTLEQPSEPIFYDVDGRLFERWMLKTVVNLVYENAIGGEAWRPRESLVDLAFGRSEFFDHAGLHWAPHEKQPVRSGRSRIIVRIVLDRLGRDVLGGRLWIDHWLWIISAVDLDATGVLLRRPRALEDETDSILHQAVRFTW
jgi:hypothetical protein